MIERDKLSEKIRSKSLNSVSKNIKRLTDLSFLNKSNRRKVPNLAVKSERKEFKKKNPFNTTLSVA